MYLFYHRSDLDGLCSAAIIKHKYPDIKCIGIEYGDKFPWDLFQPVIVQAYKQNEGQYESHLKAVEKQEIYMVDFSLPIKDMVWLNDFHSLTWIDHHITAIKDSEKYTLNSKGLQKVGVGACELTWNYLYPNIDVPQTIVYLSNYDVWKLENPNTLKFQYGCKSIDTSLDNTTFWNNIIKSAPSFIIDLLTRGEYILEFVKEDNKKYLKEFGTEIEFEGYKLLVCNKGMASSQLFESQWDESKYDIMVAVVMLPNKKWRISLYTTKKDINVGEIAKKFGGGGHIMAAGMVLNKLPWLYK
jgi:oligoribonuclease NrnB/cAMP/cGMP phosphodiesterase (DHH superfamily)